MSCFQYLQDKLLCNEECVDYDKHCVIREQLQAEYCYYKKRKVSSIPNKRKEVEQ